MKVEGEYALIARVGNNSSSVTQVEVVAITSKRVQLKDTNNMLTCYRTYVYFDGSDCRAFIGKDAEIAACLWVAAHFERENEILARRIERNKQRAQTFKTRAEIIRERNDNQ